MLRVTSLHKFESNVNCSTKLLRRKYLHLYSCHPRNTKRAIPYNLARKTCTIVNSEPVKKPPEITLTETVPNETKLSRQNYR